MTALFAGVFLILFAVVIVTVLLGFRFLEAQRKRQVESVLAMVSGPETGPAETTILRDIQHDDAFAGLLKRTRFSDRIPSYIQQAGLEWTVTQVVASMVIFAVVGALLGLVVRPLGFLSLSVAGSAFLLGGIPYWVLMHKRRKRMELIEDQLPEALDFLARSMRAGHAFSVSLEMVYRSLYFFTQAYHRGEATDVVEYLAANADWLGILKRKRKLKTRAAPELTNSSSP